MQAGEFEARASSHDAERVNWIGSLWPGWCWERVNVLGALSLHYLALLVHDIISVVLDCNPPSQQMDSLPLSLSLCRGETAE